MVLVLLGLVAYFIIVSRYLMSYVRSLENQLAETEHSLNATRIDLEAFKISEGSKSAHQQSEQESKVLNQLNITTFERFEEVFYA